MLQCLQETYLGSHSQIAKKRSCLSCGYLFPKYSNCEPQISSRGTTREIVKNAAFSGPTLDQLNLTLSISKVPRWLLCKFTAPAHWLSGPTGKADLCGSLKVYQRRGWWKWRGKVAKTFSFRFNGKRYIHNYFVGWKVQMETPLVSALCVKHWKK